MDPVIGLPGFGTARIAEHRQVTKGPDGKLHLFGGVVVSGLKSRDPLNTGDLDVLRAGVLLGKITANNKFAPSILGVTTAPYVDNDLTLTVSAATATEIVRRIGSTGTLKLVGPPTAAGVVATASVVYTAVNTTTGVITVPDLNADFISGSFIKPADGSETILTLVGDGFGEKVTDREDNNADVPVGNVLVGGVLESSQIVNWPSDTSLRSHIEDSLQDSGLFVFSHKF